MIDRIIIKEIGQTIEHNGETILVSKNMPANCIVLFVSMETWHEIEEEVIKESE